jgi:hypothetical protein
MGKAPALLPEAGAASEPMLPCLSWPIAIRPLTSGCAQESMRATDVLLPTPR